MTSALDRWPIVGRHEDLEAFERALAGPSAGFLVHGPAGVGKTRLAEECRTVAERLGHTTAVAVASRTAAQLPLGALAHLIPPDLASGLAFDPVRLFDHVREDLESRLGGKPLILSVDDVHLLDVTSATLVSQLLAAGLAFLIGTIREGEPVPDAVSALWRNGTVTRVDLGALGPDDVATVLHLALGGPVAADVTDRMWQASQGNALFLRELVLEAIGTGALQEVDGEWRAEQLPTGSRRLVELVADRIGALDDTSRGVLDLLALCEPVGATDLEQLASSTLLEDLEEAGLLQVTIDRRRQFVSLAHPLYAEALRAALPRLRSRRILREHIARIEAHGALRRADALRIATWRLDADGHADPELLLRGAMVARHANDHRQAERLARAAHTVAPSFQGGLLLGEALYELGSFDEAGQVLAAVDALSGLDPDQVLQVTVMRCKNLHWGHCDPDGALAVNFAARPRVGPKEMPEMIADEASIQLFSGNPLAALALFEDLGDGSQLTDPRDRVIRALSEAPSLALMGHTSRAIEVAERAFSEHLALTEPLALAHPGSHLISQIFALMDAGRFDEANALATAGYEATSDESAPIARIWFILDLGRIELLRGHPRSAVRWYLEGTALARASHFDGPLRLGLSGLAMGHALLGDGPEARAVLTQRDALPVFDFVFPEQIAAAAWVEQANGDPIAAKKLLLDGADRALETGHRVSASWLLHDATRLGATGLEGRLADLAADTDSSLIDARAAQAAALASGRGDELAAMVDRWVELGAHIDAAETAIAAAEAFRRAEDQRSAATLDRRADALVLECEGARTPALTRIGGVVPLSRREREIALLAAQGIASKEISDRLFLSIRTVNNHLQRAYTKLGVTSRAELAHALGV
ncbi:MAG: HTH-type transcriptional regulator malT [Acidimicrobiales bacterium]|nr:HTH-type transcriptional regulator malT [Acidimicrobiales bacterium]